MLMRLVLQASAFGAGSKGAPLAMGVKGLWDLLSATGRTVEIEAMGNKTLAVDASIWIYQVACDHLLSVCARVGHQKGCMHPARCLDASSPDASVCACAKMLTWKKSRPDERVNVPGGTGAR